MNKIIALILFASFLSACAAAAATPVAIPPTPTAVVATVPTLPSKTAAPGPTRAAISVSDVKQDTQANGTVSTTANVAAEGLGLGQIEVSSPEKMILDETATVSLKLSGAQQLVSGSSVAVPAKTPDLPGFTFKFTGNIQLFPVMFAQLRALRFDVSPTGSQKRSIDSTSTTVTWNWLVSPKAIGRQDLSIELGIPAIVNGSASELNTDVLQNIPISIQVNALAPTPVPLTNRLADSIVNNTGSILVALIGLIGTLIGILIKLRSDQGKADDASSKRRKS